MQRKSLALIAAAALLSGSAHASDLPTKAAVYSSSNRSFAL